MPVALMAVCLVQESQGLVLLTDTLLQIIKSTQAMGQDQAICPSTAFPNTEPSTGNLGKKMALEVLF